MFVETSRDLSVQRFSLDVCDWFFLDDGQVFFLRIFAPIKLKLLHEKNLIWFVGCV